MGEIPFDGDGTLSLCRLDASWSRRAADFDARIFGDEAWPFEVWQEMLANSEFSFFAYVRPPEGMQTHGDIVALGGISSGNTPEILTIGVEQSYRGQGLGAQLLDFLIAQAEQKNATHLTLEVRADNEQALALYTSRGFTPCVNRHRHSKRPIRKAQLSLIRKL
ncbi:MAG: GNAT family N-acetyltransferase [Actinomycetaceae bacterium]|nr:GNAT family N-acetyltransferase [Actinomycetaceae bacterium]